MKRVTCHNLHVKNVISTATLFTMSLRHAILGLLARRASNGYELTRMFDQTLSTTWHARHSQIYPELTRLDEAGLVEVIGHGPRRSKTYALTDAGRGELRRWLLEAEPDRSVRNESGVRLFLTLLLEPAERARAFERDLQHVEAEINRFHEIRSALAEAESPEPFAPQVELGIALNTAIRDWLKAQLGVARASAG